MKNLLQAINAVDVSSVTELLKFGVEANVAVSQQQQQLVSVVASETLPLVAAIDKLLSLEDAAQYPELIAIIKLLLDAGANPNVVMMPKQEGNGSNKAASLLHFLISRYTETRETKKSDGARLRSFFCFKSLAKVDVTAKNAAILEVIKLLVVYRVNLESCDSFQRTPLLYAIYLGHEEIAEYLLAETTAVITRCDQSGDSALHLACAGGMYDIAEQLMIRGLEVNQKNGYLNTPFFLVCQSCKCDADFKFVLFLLQHGADLNASSHPVNQFMLFRSLLAANEQNLLLYLLQHHGLAQYKDERGETALHLACESRNLAVVKLLLQYGADINAVNSNRETPLLTALSRARYICSITDNLFSSADDHQFFDFLHAQGARFDALDAQGRTILHNLENGFIASAIASSSPEKTLIVQQFLQYGVPSNALDNTGSTFAHVIFSRFPQNISVELMQLICRSCDITICDQEGKLFFERIVFKNHCWSVAKDVVRERLELVLVLLQQNFPRHLPKNSADLFLFAVYSEHYEFVEELLQRGFDFNINLQKRTLPLLTSNNFDFLMQHGLDIKNISLQLVITDGSLDYLLLQKLVVAGVAVTAEDDITQLFYKGVMQENRAQQAAFIATGNLLLSKLSSETYKKKMLAFLLNGCFSSGWLEVFFEFIWNTIIESPSPQLTPQEIEVLIEVLVRYKQYELIAQLRSKVDSDFVLNCSAMTAVKHSDTECLQWLLTAGFSFKQRIFFHDYRMAALNVFEYVIDKTTEINGDTYKELKPEQERLLFFLLNAGAEVNHSFRDRSGQEISLLHLACQYGWFKIAELLVAKYPALVNLEAHGAMLELAQTPLAIAIEKQNFGLVNMLLSNQAICQHLLPLAASTNNIALVEVLLKYKAEVDVVDAHNQTALYKSFVQENLALAKLLLEHGANTEIVAQYGFFGISLLNVCSQKAKKEELVALLLERSAKPIKITPGDLLLMGNANLRVDLFLQLIKRVSPEMVAAARLLHVALIKNNEELVMILLQDFSVLLVNSRNRSSGSTPLHMAASMGNRKMYDLLLKNGANEKLCDYENFSPFFYALFSDKIEQLGLSLPPWFKLDFAEFKKLRVKLVNYTSPEDIALNVAVHDADFILNMYTYKLLGLFASQEKALVYVKNKIDHKSRHPLHDLCLFNLPSNDNWQRAKWADLALQFGNEVTKYLHLADRVESLLGRAPVNVEEIQTIVAKIKYAREAENPVLARVFNKCAISEGCFNRVLDDYKPKEHDDLPNLFVDGEQCGKPRFYLKKLSPRDLRGFVLGMLTHCCQSVGSAGDACAWHGMTSRYGGFYAVFKRNDQVEIEKYRKLLALLEESHEPSEFLAKFASKSQKAQRIKYQKIIEGLRGETPAISEENLLLRLRDKLSEELAELSEGELIAQCWVFVGKNGGLVFDSWERLRSEDDVLCELLLKAAASQAIERFGFPRVLLGMGGQTPDNLSFVRAKEPEVPCDYEEYRDSHQQFEIAKRDVLGKVVSCSEASRLEEVPLVTPALIAHSLLCSQFEGGDAAATASSSDFLERLRRISDSYSNMRVLDPLSERIERFATWEFKVKLKEILIQAASQGQANFSFQPIFNQATKIWSCIVLDAFMEPPHDSSAQPTAMVDVMCLEPIEECLYTCFRYGGMGSDGRIRSFFSLHPHDDRSSSLVILLNTISEFAEQFGKGKANLAQTQPLSASLNKPK